MDIGLLIILLGIALLLNNLNITNINIISIFFTYWPILLLLCSTSFLSNWESRGEFFTGIIIAIIGISFLGRNLNLFHIDLMLFWKLFWPTLLIFRGVSFLFGFNSAGKSNFAFLGGIEKKNKPWNSKSSSYFAFIGGVELDLTIADIPDGEHLLDLTAVMGGIDIIVPSDVEVHCQGIVSLGGLELLNRSTGGVITSARSFQKRDLLNDKTIKIYSRALMGGNLY